MSMLYTWGDLESQDQSATLVGDISKGLFDVLFASPESLLGCNNKALKAIFVDEAHCIKKL